MGKRLITFIFIISMIMAFSEILLASLTGGNFNPFDYARITDVDYKAVLVDEPGSKGKVVVTERLTYDIHAASKNNLFWELWRDLPESYIDGVKVDFKVNSVKQILDDGTEVIYDESPRLYWYDSDYTGIYGNYGPGKWYHSEGPYNEAERRYECVLFYVDGLYREKVTFEIEYEINNAALRYGDCSELYLSLYSGNSIKYLNTFNAQILIPNEDMPQVGNYDAYTYGTNSNRFSFTESDSLNPGYHTFSFNLDKSSLKFRPYNKYIEFSLISYGNDSHIFTDYASINNYYYDDVFEELMQEQMDYDNTYENYKIIKLIVLLVALIISYFILKNANKKIKKIKEKYVFYDSTVPLGYFRDIPSNLDPIFASTLVFCKDGDRKNDSDGYSSVLLSLVRKGYIELAKIDNSKDWVSDNVKIIIKYKITMEQSQEQNKKEQAKLELLTPTEDEYFNLINRYAHGNEISIKNLNTIVSIDYENINSFIKNINDAVVTIGVYHGYFQKADYK